MARKVFFIIAFGGLASTLFLSLFSTAFLWLLLFFIPYTLLGLWDINRSKNQVLYNYPVIGHIRFALEFISPEIHQYFIENYSNGRPFNREIRNLVAKRAKNSDDNHPFGTQLDLFDVGYIRANHSLAPKKVTENQSRVLVGGPQCKQPYLASRLNISAMSFGALSAQAVLALNSGAQIGNFAHNTGEGGLSDYHLQGGGDLIWQIGTGYFGCRTKAGKFDPELFQKKASTQQVKMIEIKLSQGAKPSHGGVLPAAKVSEEIAKIRIVDLNVDVISPPTHDTFSTPTGLLAFVQQLRELSSGKPIGFKLCIGNRSEFMGICKAMLTTGIFPDFITIDGAEGGTGAAPLEYSNRLGMPLDEGLLFVHNCLVGINLRQHIKLIASGKVATGFDMISKLALGADMCNSARTMLFALGCIQALRCNTNTCPTGITTQDQKRSKAIDVNSKKYRVANYQKATVSMFLDLLGAMGLEHPDQLVPSHVYRRVADETDKTYDEIYEYIQPGSLLTESINSSYTPDWQAASENYFTKAIASSI